MEKSTGENQQASVRRVGFSFCTGTCRDPLVLVVAAASAAAPAAPAAPAAVSAAAEAAAAAAALASAFSRGSTHVVVRVLACGRRNGERTDSPLAAAGPLVSLGSAGEAMRLYRLEARREPRLLQTALSGTDADLS